MHKAYLKAGKDASPFEELFREGGNLSQVYFTDDVKGSLTDIKALLKIKPEVAAEYGDTTMRSILQIHEILQTLLSTQKKLDSITLPFGKIVDRVAKKRRDEDDKNEREDGKIGEEIRKIDAKIAGIKAKLK